MQLNDQSILNVMAHAASRWSAGSLIQVQPHTHPLVRNIGVELSLGLAGDGVRLGNIEFTYSHVGLQIVSADGVHIASMIHQYDRFSSLRSALVERWTIGTTGPIR